MRKPTWQVIFILVLCSILLSCISTPALPDNKRPLSWAQSIDPALNLYQVDQHLYRSQQPSASNVALLQRLHIGTVINLRNSQTDQDLSGVAPLMLINVPMQTWAISSEEIAHALIQIQDHRQQSNVLVHCQHGADRTGVVIAMYRIIYQHWTIDAARDEMKHGGFGFHPIWINIDHFFAPKYIQQIKQDIQKDQQNNQQKDMKNNGLKQAELNYREKTRHQLSRVASPNAR